jgi:protein tyrosine/serine phosphatase
LVHDNFRVVDPGRFYRSGQMSAARLERVIARYGVRTVINLRGAAPPEAWYREEVAVCHTLGVAHHDLAWSMDTLPDPDSLAQFVSWCEHAEKPILAHCQGGTHRGGVGAAVYLLTQGATVEEARLQFGPFFHNAPIGILLDLYATDEHDASLPFAEWLRTRYPAIYRAARAPSLR